MTITLQNLIMNPDGALNEIMKTRKKYLDMHKATITQGTGKDKRWSTRVPDPTKSDGRRIIRKNTREEVEEAVIRYYMNQEQHLSDSKMTVADCWQPWIDFKKAHNKKIKSLSWQRYRSDKKRFFDGTDFSRMRINKCTEKDIEDYLVSCIEEHHLTHKQTCNLAGYIKGIFYVAYRNGITDRNVWDKVNLHDVVYPACYEEKTKPDSERVLSDIQIQRVTEAIKTHQKRLPGYMPDFGILIAKYTGLRAGELAALQWDDIKDGAFYIRCSERRIVSEDGNQGYEVGDTKTHRERVVPICGELSVILDQIQKIQADKGIESPYILCDENGRITAKKIERAAWRRGNEAGIEGSMTIHRIRRTVASRLNTIYDRATVSHIMGHTEAVDARHYDYDTVQLSDQQESFDKLYSKETLKTA